MQIGPRTVSQFHYTLTNDEGAVLDSSRSASPLTYLHGVGGIVPGLEKAMAGRSGGDIFKVSLTPAEGYGERIAAMVQQAPISMFPNDVTPEVGMQFRADTERGPVEVTVVAIDDELVTLDGNHALAGQTLHFDVEVLKVRDATIEEMQHGHVHGDGGHHH